MRCRYPGLRNPAYDMPPGQRITCTIAELNVFLPLWFQNKWLASHIGNSGLTPEAHSMMVKAHWTLPESTSDADLLDWINQGYEKAEFEAHNPLTSEYSAVIIMNGFVHDNIDGNPTALRSTSTISKDLANRLKRLPDGPDAADLTRAVDYAMEHQRLVLENGHVEFLFPDYWQEILGVIDGTDVTAERQAFYV